MFIFRTPHLACFSLLLPKIQWPVVQALVQEPSWAFSSWYSSCCSLVWMSPVTFSTNVACSCASPSNSVANLTPAPRARTSKRARQLSREHLLSLLPSVFCWSVLQALCCPSGLHFHHYLHELCREIHNRPDWSLSDSMNENDGNMMGCWLVVKSRALWLQLGCAVTQ